LSNAWKTINLRPNDCCALEMLLGLKAPLASFGLTLHEDKMRLIEFRRFAGLSRQRSGERRPKTFAFLGFTHYCGLTRDRRFIVKHKTEGTPDAQADGDAPGCLAVHARATGHAARSPPFCAGTTATMAGRTIIQRSTGSTAKCAGPGCVV
jgi:hypothetical protein